MLFHSSSRLRRALSRLRLSDGNFSGQHFGSIRLGPEEGKGTTGSASRRAITMAPPRVSGTSFSVVRKKTPFQKHQAEEELKRKRDAEEAAKLFDEFEADFADEKKSKTGVTMNFVSAGVQAAGSRPGAEMDDCGRRKKYVPSFVPHGMTSNESKSKGPSAADDGRIPVRSRPTGFSDAPPPTTTGRGGGSKPRAIDLVMEEMVAKQQERDKAKREGRDVDFGERRRGPSKEDRDPYSTNLYLGNLPREIDEQKLMEEFAKYGPIASVKVMWPREDEDVRLKSALTGFVAFMTRSSAEKAKEEMDGKVLLRHDIRVGWGKSVPLPAKPVWPLVDDEEEEEGEYNRRKDRLGERGMNGVQGIAPSAPEPKPGVPEIIVTFPEDQRVMSLIDTLARYVAEDGYVFERAVMEQQRDTDDFKFLFDTDCPEHRYYRWRVFSLAQGDTLSRWRTDPFIMIAGGLRWTPPDPANRPSETVAPGIVAKTLMMDEVRLGEADETTFTNLLRTLTIEREGIEEGMSFALDHAEAAHDVVEILTEALTLSETPVPMKVARLFLVSDILHNCGAPVKNASAYRGAFQEKLPYIFTSLEEMHRGISSRITREAFKKRVMAVTAAWADWFLYADDFLKGLEATFARGGLPAPPSLSEEEAQKLRLEIEAMDAGECERACRIRGLIADGGHEACIKRLIDLETYIRSSTKHI